ncbi:MAG: acyl-CoA dehydrogenase family protein [Acidimicrobiales bacterium]
MREELVPGIVRGEIYFSIGMSEPDSGSDLASIRSTAKKVDGGYLVNGTKVWTSQAHNNHYFIVLVRTTPAAESQGRHNGMSQFVLDLRSPAWRSAPSGCCRATTTSTRVVMNDVFVPDHMLLGTEGNGWAQVIGELAYEFGPGAHPVHLPAARLAGRRRGPEPRPRPPPRSACW